MFTRALPILLDAMDGWFLKFVRRLPAPLALYAISAGALIGLARLCLPLLLTVLEKDLTGDSVTETLALLLVWIPALAVIGFFVFTLVYLYRLYRRSKRE